jgi:hypothetical protein
MMRRFGAVVPTVGYSKAAHHKNAARAIGREMRKRKSAFPLAPYRNLPFFWAAVRCESASQKQTNRSPKKPVAKATPLSNARIRALAGSDVRGGWS